MRTKAFLFVNIGFSAGANARLRVEGARLEDFQSHLDRRYLIALDFIGLAVRILSPADCK